MYIEKRKHGKSIKFYLVYSYREEGNVKKIRKYLGQDLSERELKNLRKKAEEEIKEQLDNLLIKLFDFSLTKNQLNKLNNYVNKVVVFHLEDWDEFTEKFVYNTNAIEGSTVEQDEVIDILENKKPAKDNDEKETKGVAKALNYIRKTKKELSLNLIKKLHELCFENSKSFAGKFRKVEVVVRNSKGDIIHKGVPASELDDYLNDLIEWYNKHGSKFKPLILAAIIHNQFEHIHPFQDGNGRVGRLLLNFILLKSKYPPINIKLENRKDYYSVLKEYSDNHNLTPTIKFLINQYKKTLKDMSTKNKK
ncbi:MAG: Fic family protein [Nanoarchaeota archaeon]|nr:Fic family protein [Nanoarchaeota archaeon]